MTERLYSLAQLTALPYTPPQMVQLAADTGCDGCGVRLLPASPGGLHHLMPPGSPLLRETRARIDEIYAHHTGQPLDQVHTDMERDRFFKPEEAVEYGLIDKVISSH